MKRLGFFYWVAAVRHHPTAGARLPVSQPVSVFHVEFVSSHGIFCPKKSPRGRFSLKLDYRRSCGFHYTSPRTQRGLCRESAGHLPPVVSPSAAPFTLLSRSQFDKKGKKMAKRCAFLLVGLALMSSTIGCCCGLGRYNACSPCGPCGAGGCAPSYYPPSGGVGYYQGYGSTAYMGGYGSTAYAGDPSMMTASPVIPGTTYSTTALAPINSLPTY